MRRSTWLLALAVTAVLLAASLSALAIPAPSGGPSVTVVDGGDAAMADPDHEDEGDEDDGHVDEGEFEASVAAADANAGTFTLANGTVVHVTDDTVIDPEGDLLTLEAVEDALAQERDVRAEGEARPWSEASEELEALTVEFEVDDDEDDVDDDEEFDDDFHDEERELKVDIEDQEVTIKLESKAAGREDEVKVQFNAAEGEMKVSFEREDNGEEEVEMRVTFRSLDEIVADEDAAFGFTVVQRFPLANLTLMSLDQADFTADNGATGKRIAATYALPGTEDGTFGLVFWVFGEFAFVNGVPVRPTEVKIDILLTDFPFEEPEGEVAVNLVVRTEFEVEMGGAHTLDEVLARGEEFAAFFRWADTASVDGVPLPVASVTLRESVEAEAGADEGEFEKKVHLLLVYPQGAEIVHDPLVGVERIASRLVSAAGPSALAFVLGLATASLLVLGAWAAGRRRW